MEQHLKKPFYCKIVLHKTVMPEYGHREYSQEFNCSDRLFLSFSLLALQLIGCVMNTVERFAVNFQWRSHQTIGGLNWTFRIGTLELESQKPQDWKLSSAKLSTVQIQPTITKHSSRKTFASAFDQALSGYLMHDLWCRYQRCSSLSTECARLLPFCCAFHTRRARIARIAAKGIPGERLGEYTKVQESTLTQRPFFKHRTLTYHDIAKWIERSAIQQYSRCIHCVPSTLAALYRDV